MIFYVPLPGCLRFEKMDVVGTRQLTLTKWEVDKDFEREVVYVLNENNIPHRKTE